MLTHDAQTKAFKDGAFSTDNLALLNVVGKFVTQDLFLAKSLNSPDTSYDLFCQATRFRDVIKSRSPKFGHGRHHNTAAEHDDWQDGNKSARKTR